MSIAFNFRSKIYRNNFHIENEISFQHRNLFFKAKYRGHVVGVDGLMLDIMRNRDGGVPPFIDYYPMCLNINIESWNDLRPFFKRSHFKLLRQLYEKVEDIEFMVGLLLEKREDGGNTMGKIGRCIVAKEFYNKKHGDRFFYTHQNVPHRFSKGLIFFSSTFYEKQKLSWFVDYSAFLFFIRLFSEQLDAIKQMTFSRLVCMTTDVGIVPKHGFISVSPQNPFVSCNKFKPFNLSPFKRNL